MINSFDDFYKELTSDQQWYELLRMYKDDTIRKAAEKVYAILVTDKILDIRPWNENRKHVFNILKKECPNGDKPKGKDWYIIKQEEKEAEEKKEWVPASKEFAEQKAKEALEIIANSKTLNGVPKISHKQSVEEGGWIPKKQAPYKGTSPMDYYLRQRHYEYIKQNYDAKTAQKLPGWCDEDTFNLMFDDVYYEDYMKAFKKD